MNTLRRPWITPAVLPIGFINAGCTPISWARYHWQHPVALSGLSERWEGRNSMGSRPWLQPAAASRLKLAAKTSRAQPAAKGRKAAASRLLAFLRLGLELTADGEGFEPPVPFGTPVFKTGAIDHSATHPVNVLLDVL
jgi:hypothetical protein